MTAAAFEAIYRNDQRAPWDQDGPTAFVVELEREGYIRGAVLDVGCGTGENALYLASRGHEVVGLDGAPTAIERAREKARARGIDVPFQLADARDLTGYSDRFDTVIDIGLFHVFDQEEDRLRYAASLQRACRPGALLHLLCFNAHNDFDVTIPRPRGCGTHPVDEVELRRAFGDGWAWESFTEVTGRSPGREDRRFWLLRVRKSA
ncbi:class I SAM-dependent methyltransferase [Pendulispora rubella]|uniref:Class I SAM-dependent methyltransferase n=1 Tax=Pendulispora rubella TaxID=2741070 RepID=A0ABZ2L963_9BACT